jgi:UDP-glucose 4-epimerase
MVEHVFSDISLHNPDFNISVLRYFNPIGAHPTGLIGESPKGIPNNLMPYICEVAVKSRDFVSVVGNDYKTADGTGVRDYLHVVDLAKGHDSTLHYCKKSPGKVVINLGTGKGYSVLQMIEPFRGE